MSRPRTYSVALLVALLTLPSLAASTEIPTAQQTSSPVSATDAAPFIGDWTLEMQGANGPATMGLAVKAEQEKVSAELVSDAMGDSGDHEHRQGRQGVGVELFIHL